MANFVCVFITVLMTLATTRTNKKLESHHQTKKLTLKPREDSFFDLGNLKDKFEGKQGAFGKKSEADVLKNGFNHRDPAYEFKTEQEDDWASEFLCKSKIHGREVVKQYKLENITNLKIKHFRNRSMRDHEKDLSDCDRFELEKNFRDSYAADDEDFRYMSVEFRSFEDGHRGWQEEVIKFGSQF